MILLVSNTLESTDQYKVVPFEDAYNIIKSWDVIQFDTETSGRDPHLCELLCYQLGNDSSDARVVIDAKDYPITLFKDILESKLIIGQNLKFDLQFLYNYEIVPRKIWDTMIVEQLLHLGYDSKFFRVSLKAIAERRLGIDIDKTVRGEIIWRGLDSNVVIYAAGDVTYLEKIYEQQLQECKDKSCYNGAKLENSFVAVIAYLEWCGIHLDVNKWKTKMQKDENGNKEALENLNKWAISFNMQHKDFPIKMYKIPDASLFEEFNTGPICTVNWSSAQQVIPIVEALGFDVSAVDKKTGESKKSVNAKILIKQKGVNDEFIKLYLAVKETEIVCNTFGQKYLDAINPITNRIHTVFRQLGASSGRMSCGSKNENTDLTKYKHLPKGSCQYPQLQNLPSDHDTRMAFSPEDGNLLTSCDYAALESRLGADIYNEQSMLKEYLEGSGDIHSLTAKHCFKELKDVPVKDIKKLYPDLRKRAKPVEFSQQFGGSARAIQNSLGCSMQEAKEIAQNYNEGFKGISEFRKKGAAFVRKYGYVLITPVTGHKIYWEDFDKWTKIESIPDDIRRATYSKQELKEHNMAISKWERLSLNSPTQGTGACIIKLSNIMFFKWIISSNLFGKVKLCNIVHDENVIEYPKELKDVVVPKLVECMENAASVFCKKLPIPAEPETGLGWIH